MKEERRLIKLGSRVKLLDDVEMFSCTYKKGHEFTVYGQSCRGFDLMDDNGNKIDESLFINNKLELISKHSAELGEE